MSWKTTLFGLMAAIGGGILGAYILKPELLAGFPTWLPGLGVLMSSIGTACLGVAARDNNKTSEQVGAGGQSQVSTKVLLFFLLGSLAVGTVVLQGCQAPPQRMAFNAVKAPAVTADQAMTLWGDYVHQFHPPASQERQVLDTYRKYKVAELAAIDAAQLAANSMSSTNSLLSTVTTQLQSPQAAQALADLVSLLRQFGVNL